MATFDSYNLSNRNTSEILYTDGLSWIGVGQSFTGSAGKLMSVDFYLKKSGSPTGNITVKLHTHSGTFGTSSIPGTLLATANTIDASTLTTSFAIYNFVFATPYQMTNGTKYVVGLEYSTGSNVNYVEVGYDNSSPTHDGNMSRLISGSWSASSGSDAVFYAYDDVYPKFDTLTDNFNDNSLNTSLWTVADGASETNQRIQFTPAQYFQANLAADNTYSLQSSYVLLEMPTVGTIGADHFIDISVITVDGSESGYLHVYFQLNNTTLEFRKGTYSDNVVIGSATYNNTTHRWLRIRETAGTIYGEYSTNTGSWSSFGNFSTSTYSIGAMTFNAHYINNTASGNTVAMDNFNNPNLYITGTGIASSEAFGTATVTVLNQFLQVTGISSAEAFGATALVYNQTVSPSSIGSAEAFGTATVFLVDQYIIVTGIPSGEAFGSAEADQEIDPTGITTGEAFGLARLTQSIPPPSTKSYVYKIYDTDGTFLGQWSDEVVSEFGYSLEINSAGTAIDVVLARNSDTRVQQYDVLANDSDVTITTDDDVEITAETTTANAIGPGTTVDLNLDVKVYEFNPDDEDLEGTLVFTGYISRYVSQYGESDQTIVTIFSYGAELDNWVLEDAGDTRVPYFTQDPSHILRDAIDKFNAADGIPTYIAGDEVYDVITNLITNPSFETDETGWTINQGIGGDQADGTAPQGAKSFFLQNVGGGDASFSTGNLVDGEEYTFSIYIKHSGNSSSLTGAHDGNTVFSTTSFTTGWVRHNWTFTATANTPLSISVNKSGSDTILYIDGLMLTAGDTLYTYFDGATTDGGGYTYDWTGTAHLSTSTKSSLAGYENSSIDDTDTVASYTFNVNTMLEVLKKCLELAPTDWYFYLDLATNIIYFKERPTVAAHKFILGEHILGLNLEKYIEDITNLVYFTGGETAGVNLFKKYTDSTSITNYRRGLERITDKRVTLATSADIIADSVLDRGSEPRYRSQITISDQVYDIKSIKLGELIGFRNFGNYVDDVTMQVVRIAYRPDSVTLQLDTLLPSVPKRLEDIKRNLRQEEFEDNPDAPDV